MNRQQMKVDVGAKLLQLRKEQGKSLRELSKLSGISANAISLIERDKISPTIATLTKLIIALNTNLTFLFDEKESKDIIYISNNGQILCWQMRTSALTLTIYNGETV